MRRDDARYSQTPRSFLLLFSFLALLLQYSRAQPAGLDSYYCSANRTIYPCQAYILYRAGVGNRSPLDLASVGDLFDVSRLTVARASNLSVDSFSATLRPGQPLLIPLSCSCDASNRSFSPISYQIADGDTFFILSTSQFQNLTTYSFIESLNPSLDHTNLAVGTPVTIPIFCQCPNSSGNGVVTYVFQPHDTYSSVASNFGTNLESLVSLNGPEVRIWPYSTILVPLAQNPPPLLANASELPPSPPPSSPPDLGKEERKGLTVGLSVGLGMMGILFVLALLLFTWFRRRYSGETTKETAKSKLGRKNSKWFARIATNKKLITDVSEWLDKYKVYEIEELRRGTADFDSSRLIQGSVYKGIMDGKVFAVKKVKWNACDELNILQKVNHANLVKLEGFGMDLEAAGTCYLVYEYVENGSLRSCLRDHTTSSRLDWRSRLRIALDVAHGLQYIHDHTTPCVVHKDIKSSNVLLDSRLRAKIANFGLAKAAGCNVVTTHIVGTQGYIAPEYLADGLVTAKMDVFAYGVVLLELVSGREAMSEEGEALWAEAEGVFERGREEGVAAWMDPALAGQCCPSMESVVGVFNVAMACLRRDPAGRPSMGDVAYALYKAEELLSNCSGDRLSGGGSGDMMMAS